MPKIHFPLRRPFVVVSIDGGGSVVVAMAIAVLRLLRLFFVCFRSACC